MAVALSYVAPANGFSPLVMPKRSARLSDLKSQSYRKRETFLKSTAASSLEIPSIDSKKSLNTVQSKIVKAFMVTYIASMCVALPVTLFPVYLLYRAKLIDRIQKETWSLKVGQFCSRWLMRIFPFASKRVVVNSDDEQLKNPKPCIWVCNHISMLDLFFVLALDNKMRGKNRRPIKILYWKGLESNPVTGLLCKMCGFIPVDMAANGNGNENEYDPKSFKQMLKSTKAAIEEGFDIGILPEGQPNPTPEQGMQPIYSGAFTLARMSRRPIKMMALYGLNRMWHPSEDIGMKCDARDMAVRVYPGSRIFKDSEEFSSTFEAVAGYFGAHGCDMPKEELNMWLDGSMWKTEQSRRTAARLEAEDIPQEGMSQNKSDATVKKQ
eukprot:CAMPEP_0183728520 /NCGR_PEP_ID=MMETSP0737-20130205/28258_1 /TAXON_ID=385413 /ORGANISM="Thalassiosira miniscula, Strain CCMP1093" /LENGTH=380 /DNA_ID=CAMNT_0025960485 /DNA_START=107 /DNA_END=1249 /DNA_ORIENTATION=+